MNIMKIYFLIHLLFYSVNLTVSQNKSNSQSISPKPDNIEQIATQCGVSNQLFQYSTQALVIGGKDAAFGAWPWQVFFTL